VRTRYTDALIKKTAVLKWGFEEKTSRRQVLHLTPYHIRKNKVQGGNKGIF